MASIFSSLVPKPSTCGRVRGDLEWAYYIFLLFGSTTDTFSAPQYRHLLEAQSHLDTRRRNSHPHLLSAHKHVSRTIPSASATTIETGSVMAGRAFGVRSACRMRASVFYYYQKHPSKKHATRSRPHFISLISLYRVVNLFIDAITAS